MNEQMMTPCRSRFTVTTRLRIEDRRGFTIVELIATCLLLGVLFSITVPMFAVVARERRSTEQRQFALQHAANLLEHATSRPWSEIPVGELNLPDADPDLQIVLPSLERTLVVKQIEGQPESRQIIASIQWQGSSGQMVSPLRVSAWVYPTKEGK